MGLAVALGLGVPASVPGGAYALQGEQRTEDVLIFANGTVLTGTIVSETATTIRFQTSRSGITSTTDFAKSDILEIKRATAKAGPEPAGPASASSPRPAERRAAAEEPRSEGPTVYYVKLTGVFGESISQTPIREAVDDARRVGAEVIIFRLENEWSDELGLARLPDDTANIREIFRAEEITPIFVNHIPSTWEKRPRIVFWVDQAMGGSCLLPLVSPEIYFTRRGRMGGLGNLQFIFGNTGDATVRQKMFSAYLGHAEGWAQVGGYPAEIVRAMVVFDYVLSYKLVGGRPVFFTRMPEGPDEILLTDDGKENTPRADTMRERVRGEGNDVLTLNERLARDLLVSKGTADTLDDLLLLMGLQRTARVIEDRPARIMQRWNSNLEGAKKAIKTALEDFARAEVRGNYDERQRARATRIRKLDEIDSIIKRFGEGISARWLWENNVPDEQTRRTIKEQIRLEMMADRR
jgi:hypothetical protein